MSNLTELLDRLDRLEKEFNDDSLSGPTRIAAAFELDRLIEPNVRLIIDTIREMERGLERIGENDAAYGKPFAIARETLERVEKMFGEKSNG